MPLIQKAPPRRRTIGVDLAISGAQVAQVFDDGKPVGKPVRFRLTSADLARFISVVLSGTDASTQLTAVMEPTGMSWFPVAAWLRRAGITVIRVKGQRVKALRKYLSEHAKTDTLRFLDSSRDSAIVSVRAFPVDRLRGCDRRGMNNLPVVPEPD